MKRPILILLVLLALTGIGVAVYWPRSTSTGAGTAGGATLEEKSAMTGVLKHDKAIRIAGGDSKKIATAMSAVELQGCPSSFQEAYRKHTGAWEKYDLGLIEKTWENVRRIARDYGVDVTEFQ